MPRTKPPYPPEFRREAVELARYRLSLAHTSLCGRVSIEPRTVAINSLQYTTAHRLLMEITGRYGPAEGSNFAEGNFVIGLFLNSLAMRVRRQVGGGESG